MLSGWHETRAHASEIKFLVPASIGDRVCDWGRRHLAADPHGQGAFGDGYDTRTIYFDTAGRDVLRGRASFGRCKYRIRRYNAADLVFLERKLRRPGLLTKRRTSVELTALPALSELAANDWAGDWFRRRLSLRQLQPVCEIGYHRIARTGTSVTGPVRLTLDSRLAARPLGHLSFDPHFTGQPMIEGWSILELKFRRDVPAIFKRLIAEFTLEPRSLSKYRLAMALLEPTARAPSTGERPGATPEWAADASAAAASEDDRFGV